MVEFLSLSNEAFGLEITDTAVRLVKLARRGNKIAAAAIGYAAVAPGVVKEGEVRNADKLAVAIKMALANAAGEKIRTRRVVVSLPENKAFLQVIRMPRLRDQDLRAAVTFEAENYIPLPLEKVYLDFETVSGSRPSGAGCEVLIAALPRPTIDARLAAVVKAGLAPVAMELESQAVARALLAGRAEAAPTIILQIGDEKTNLIVHSDNSVRFTFSIPISNRFFLETIGTSVGVDAKEAGKLKTRCGIEEFIRLAESGAPADDLAGRFQAAGDRRKIFEALVPGLVDFAQQAKKCLQYYQTHEAGRAAGKDPIEKILICGSGSDLKGIDEFIALKLNARVERTLPLIDEKTFDSLAGTGKTDQSVCGFVVAVGLAMRALGGAERSQKNDPSAAAAAKKRLPRKPFVKAKRFQPIT